MEPTGFSSHLPPTPPPGSSPAMPAKVSSPYNAGSAAHGVSPHTAIMTALEDSKRIDEKNLTQLKVKGAFEQKGGGFGQGDSIKIVADENKGAGSTLYFKFNMQWTISAKDSAGKEVEALVQQYVYTSVEIPTDHTSKEFEEAKQKAFMLAKSFELVQRTAINLDPAKRKLDDAEADKVKASATLTFTKTMIAKGSAPEEEVFKLMVGDKKVDLAFLEKSPTSRKVDNAARPALTRMKRMSEAKVVMRSAPSLSPAFTSPPARPLSPAPGAPSKLASSSSVSPPPPSKESPVPPPDITASAILKWEDMMLDTIAKEVLNDELTQVVKDFDVPIDKGRELFMLALAKGESFSVEDVKPFLKKDFSSGDAEALHKRISYSANQIKELLTWKAESTTSSVVAPPAEPSSPPPFVLPPPSEELPPPKSSAVFTVGSAPIGVSEVLEAEEVDEVQELFLANATYVADAKKALAQIEKALDDARPNGVQEKLKEVENALKTTLDDVQRKEVESFKLALESESKREWGPVKAQFKEMAAVHAQLKDYDKKFGSLRAGVFDEINLVEMVEDRLKDIKETFGLNDTQIRDLLALQASKSLSNDNVKSIRAFQPKTAQILIRGINLLADRQEQLKQWQAYQSERPTIRALEANLKKLEESFNSNPLVAPIVQGNQAFANALEEVNEGLDEIDVDELDEHEKTKYQEAKKEIAELVKKKDALEARFRAIMHGA